MAKTGLAKVGLFPKPLEFHTTSREPKRAHSGGPAFKITTKIPRKKYPQEREERMKRSGRGKKTKFWVVRRRGVWRREVQRRGAVLGQRGLKVWGQSCGQFGSERLGVKCFGFECSGFGLRMRCAGAKKEDKEFKKSEKENTFCSISANFRLRPTSTSVCFPKSNWPKSNWPKSSTLIWVNWEDEASSAAILAQACLCSRGTAEFFSFVCAKTFSHGQEGMDQSGSPRRSSMFVRLGSQHTSRETRRRQVRRQPAARVCPRINLGQQQARGSRGSKFHWNSFAR